MTANARNQQFLPSVPRRMNNARRNGLIAAILVAMTAAVYAPVWTFEFVSYDDADYVSENLFVQRGFEFENVVNTFTTSYAANWIPLTWLSLMANAKLFGFEAGSFHIVNAILHGANALLLFAALNALTACPWRSAFAAALFAVHPLHVESVAWVTERKDVLSTFFGFLSLWAYAVHARQNAGRWYAISLVAFVCSLMSKQILVTLPFVYLLLDYWPLGRFERTDNGSDNENAVPDQTNPDALESPSRSTASNGRRLLIEKVPFFVAAIAACVIVLLAQQRGGAVQSLEHIPLFTRFANAVVVYVLYLFKMVWPVELSAYYTYPMAGVPIVHVVGAAVILAAVTLAVFKASRRRPYLPVGWLWYLGTLLPVIGIVQVGNQRMADRYTYFPLVGVFIAITWLMSSLATSSFGRRVVVWVLAVPLLVSLMVQARTQVGYWKDSATLFEHAFPIIENKSVAHRLLGNAYLHTERTEEGVDHFQESLKLDPSSATAHVNLGTGLLRLDRIDEAVNNFEQALQLTPTYSLAHALLANTLRDRDQIEEAISHYEQAIDNDPHNVMARINLGNVLRAQGRLDDAVDHYITAINLRPQEAAAHMNLGIALFTAGHSDEAISHLQLAWELDPESAATHYNLGAALHAVGQFGKAMSHFQKALTIDPDHSETRSSLATTHVTVGAQLAGRNQVTSAIGHFMQAIRLEPRNWRARYNLAFAYSLLGQLTEAEQQFQEAVALEPDEPRVYNDYGRLLLKQERRDRAAEQFRAALRIDPDFTEAQRNLRRATAE